jgi:hypothetical protein
LKLLKNGKNTRKQKGMPPSQITRFLGSKIPYLKNYPIQLAFVDDLALYIAKGHRPLAYVENPWLKHIVMHQNPKVVFPFHHSIVKDVVPQTLAKTMANHVFLALTSCITCTASFDLWMSWSRFDIFAMIVSFIDHAFAFGSCNS